MTEPITLTGELLDGWHSQRPKWRIVEQSYSVQPTVEDDGKIRVATPSTISTLTFTLERDRDDAQPERQTVVVSGCVVIADPPTLLLSFPLGAV